MTYTMEREGARLVVRVNGQLDIKTSPVLEAALLERLDGVTELTIDLAGVDYVSSMGLRLLLSLQKRMMGRGDALYVANARGNVMDLFVETGFSDILTLV